MQCCRKKVNLNSLKLFQFVITTNNNTPIVMLEIYLDCIVLTLGVSLFWKCNPEQARCDVVENACGARGDSNSSSSRTPRGSAWLSWNQPGAKMWRWNRDQRCVGAELPSVSLGGKRDLHKFPHIQNGSIVWNFLLTGNIPALIVFGFFLTFPTTPFSQLCSPCQHLSGEPGCKEWGTSLCF